MPESDHDPDDALVPETPAGYDPPLAAFFVFEALVFNAVGAVGDLYATAHAVRRPAGSLYYDSDVRHSYVFTPSEGRR